MNLTQRQRDLLRIIVSHYIATGEALGSEALIRLHNLDLSSATIRNEMVALEEAGYLTKEHISSGRIPSLQGYQFYAHHITSPQSGDLSTRLRDIMAQRQIAIGSVIDQAARAIAEITQLTLTISTSASNEERLKSIQLTPINENIGVVVLVTSTGRVESNTVTFDPDVKIDDVRIAIRIFNERLIDTKLSEMGAHIISIAPLLAHKIKNYEAIIQTFVNKVFTAEAITRNKVYGNVNIIRSPEIHRDDLAKIIDLIENKSIWESIESQAVDNENIKIDIRSDHIALMSKRIVSDTTDIAEISVIGPHRIDYATAKNAILLLEEFLANKNNKKPKQ